MFKKLGNWFVSVIKETLNLSWTLVGLVIATLTLTGSAQQVTGLATLITLGIWLLTISFRQGD
jgi:hypothetical protein